MQCKVVLQIDIFKKISQRISDSEGVGRVPYKGKLSEALFQYIGGLKSGMGYCGAENLKSLRKAKFTRITNSGMNESHPHNVTITKEALITVDN